MNRLVRYRILSACAIGGELSGIEELAVRGEDGIDVISGVGVDADDKRARMRNAGHGGSSFGSLFGLGVDR